MAESKGPIGWYVHLPFCRTKCGYCDFYSLPTLPHLIDDLIGAITREIELRDPLRAVETIFVGGGTPTELPGEALQHLLGYISARTGPVGEWTVEANPSSTTDLKLAVLQTAGVNRISFGAQSFHEDDLRVLERIHDPVHIGESVRAARSAGFENVNLDLIYGIPGQSVARWRETLARAIDLGAEHLSCYALMYEDGTALTRLKRDGKVAPCDEDIEAEMFDVTIETLRDADYQQYEISNFARDGRECRANIIYWENREYLGVGPSAVSVPQWRTAKEHSRRSQVLRMDGGLARVDRRGARNAFRTRAGGGDGGADAATDARNRFEGFRAANGV
ncbi:MAG: radical SAM family heme chaperone HemW [Planctomycetes bacterium]|nr:radical SAM family heme chaperone HemW [Planctomycetota bacterium]